MARRAYQRKGYTPCQKTIAEWINAGRTEIREDPQLRCYACNGQDSFWYDEVKAKGRNAVLESPLNEGTASFKFEAPNWRGNGTHTVTVAGRVLFQNVKSSHCGMVFRVRKELTGKAVLYGGLDGFS